MCWPRFACYLLGVPFGMHPLQETVILCVTQMAMQFEASANCIYLNCHDMSPKGITLQQSSQDSTRACHLLSYFIAGAADKLPISRSQNIVHILALCWVHSVIGWGFFILQSWIPTYLNHLGMTDLKTVGLLSALPWVVSHTHYCMPCWLVPSTPSPIIAHCCPLPLLPSPLMGCSLL